ncbi:MAG: serine/threonine protein kinase [Deltaproteobacteria bacterium]|nr:serine/threonine protein kinase [Deltaproteobacteria bacterium]
MHDSGQRPSVFAGKYRIDGVLGEGGMGRVLRAHHLQLDQPVAIKVMKPELLAEGDAARRFALEARATASLKSRNTVRVLDVDQLPNGVPYLVMEMLDGQDLARLVTERGPVGLDRAIHYLLQATDAIAEAHERGIVHRDLKPQNLFLTNDGVVKVLDFGLAKTTSAPPSGPGAIVAAGTITSDSSRTGANLLVGSPHYMAPEQLWAGPVTPRTDIWALGATLYHLLAGVPPFPAPNMEVLANHILTQDVAPIAKRRDDVIPLADDLIRRCMMKDPGARFASVGALQGALLHLRVELQTRRALGVTTDVASTMPDAVTARPPEVSIGSKLDGTMPVTTRRDPTRAPLGASTVPSPPSTEPDLDGDRGPIAWQGSDEPTQISATDPSGQGPSVEDRGALRR